MNDQCHLAVPLSQLVESFTAMACKVLADEKVFYTLVQSHSDGLLVVSPGGEILYANPAAEKLFFASSGGLAGKLFGYPIREGEVSEIDVIKSTRHKTTAEMHVTSLVWNDAQAFLLSLRTVAERRRLKESLRKNSDRLRALISASPLAIVAVDTRGHITLWNRAAIRIFGWSEVDMIGQPPPVTCDDSEESLRHVIQRALQGDVLHGRELVGQCRKDGGELALQLWTSPLHNSQEIADGAMIFAVDITERKRMEAHLQGVAGLDPLTGLPNRVQFRERLSLAVERATRGEQPPFAVFHFGLDRFKNVNQSFGHGMGDQLLLEVARRISSALFDTDLVARTGGDEFSILVRDVPNALDGARIAHRLLDTIRPEILLNGCEVFITASIGIVVFPHDGTDADSLLHNADAAMGLAKDQGGGACQFHTEDIDLRARRQLHMESKLHLACEREEFQLHFQPQVNPRDGRIVGVEALLRWFHPEMGTVSPASFIPVAESTGLIVPIGEWVLRAACLQASAWAEMGLPPVRVAVNLSARQLQHPQLIPAVEAALRESGLAPELLDLELTESMLVKNAEDVIAVLYGLKKLGVRLSIDDFGTGYSALSYLARMPLDTLKIDQSFVAGIGRGRTSGNIALAIIALARSLGLKTIAEGVETEEQAEFLVAHGCNEIQGYLFSPPLPADKCTVLLATGEYSGLMSRLPSVWRSGRVAERYPD